MTSYFWSSETRTETGNVRKLNEDAVFCAPKRGIWVVADGMGGYDCGDLASQLVIEVLRDIPTYATLSCMVEDIGDRLRYVNKELLGLATKRGTGTRLGSTVVVMAAINQNMATVWAGDSRLYRLRDGKLKRLTKDHSEVEKLIDLGIVKEDNADNHPAARCLTRAIGVSEKLNLDVVYDSVQKQDVYLMCTDGLNKELDDVAIEETLLVKSDDNASVCDSLIETALQRGGRDNISVVTAIAN